MYNKPDGGVRGIQSRNYAVRGTPNPKLRGTRGTAWGPGTPRSYYSVNGNRTSCRKCWAHRTKMIRSLTFTPKHSSVAKEHQMCEVKMLSDRFEVQHSHKVYTYKHFEIYVGFKTTMLL